MTFGRMSTTQKTFINNTDGFWVSFILGFNKYMFLQFSDDFKVFFGELKKKHVFISQNEFILLYFFTVSVN